MELAAVTPIIVSQDPDIEERPDAVDTYTVMTRLGCFPKKSVNVELEGTMIEATVDNFEAGPQSIVVRIGWTWVGDRKVPFELFVTLGRNGSCGYAINEGLGKGVSLLLRSTPPEKREGMVSEWIKYNSGIECPSPTGFKKNRTSSCPDAIANALKKFMDNRDEIQGIINARSL